MHKIFEFIDFIVKVKINSGGDSGQHLNVAARGMGAEIGKVSAPFAVPGSTPCDPVVDILLRSIDVAAHAKGGQLVDDPVALLPGQDATIIAFDIAAHVSR